ncbi:uncharacterized protein LOC130281556 [Hyla sarda]|uniref:uncharacterized protein LOC130281556 n=1 Tax=Hyla sarda TaxID=327740 RepID=UPI0024C38588|nr:uncharacterized protein LOC130281556 [Hyla sarda]
MCTLGNSGRKKRFSTREKQVLVEEVCAKYDLLCGRDSERLPLSHRKNIWRDICDKVNAQGIQRRTVNDIQRKWHDCRRIVKAKLVKMYHHAKQTGGGPPSKKKLDATDDLVANTFLKEQIEGIGNFDVMAGLVGVFDKNNNDVDFDDDHDSVEELSDEVSRNQTNRSQPSKRHSDSRDSLARLVRSYVEKNENYYQKFLETQSLMQNVIEKSCSHISGQISEMTAAVKDLTSVIINVCQNSASHTATHSTHTEEMQNILEEKIEVDEVFLSSIPKSNNEPTPLQGEESVCDVVPTPEKFT